MKDKMKWFVNNIPETISAITFSLMILVIAINVFIRAIFDTSIYWAEELAAICFVWCTFLGMTVAYKRSELISIDFFVRILPKRIQPLLDLFLQILMVFFNIILFYYSFRFSLSAATKISQVLRISYFYIDVVLPISFAITSFYSIKNLINSITKPSEHKEKLLADRCS